MIIYIDIYKCANSIHSQVVCHVVLKWCHLALVLFFGESEALNFGLDPNTAIQILGSFHPPGQGFLCRATTLETAQFYLI